MAFWHPVTGQAPLLARLDSTYLLIGDRTGIHLELQASGGFEPVTTLLDGIDTIPAIELLGQPEWSFEQGKWKAELAITAFDTGYFLLPPVSVSGMNGGETVTFHSARLPLEVRSVPIDTTGVKPIRPIVEEQVSWTDFKWVLTAVGVLLLFGLLAWFFRKMKQQSEEIPTVVPPVEAHILALGKLEALERAGLWQKGQVKAYYSELGDILRTYLEQRFVFLALEMTTRELELALGHIPELETFRSRSVEFLQLADLVKFAKLLPDEQVHPGWLIWVRTLVETTKKLEETEIDGPEGKQTER